MTARAETTSFDAATALLSFLHFALDSLSSAASSRSTRLLSNVCSALKRYVCLGRDWLLLLASMAVRLGGARLGTYTDAGIVDVILSPTRSISVVSKKVADCDVVVSVVAVKLATVVSTEPSEEAAAASAAG